VESMDYSAAGFAMAAVRTMLGGYPRIDASKVVNDLAGAVARSIIDNDPLNWLYGLICDRKNRLFDKLFFVPCRSDDDILGHTQISRHWFEPLTARVSL